MTARYRIDATFADGLRHGWLTAETMGGALHQIIYALNSGALRACQHDTRPDEPPPVTDAEREALAAITPTRPRTFE
jgi:hypothetical protein